jgi:excisionase family DNA binding protein
MEVGDIGNIGSLFQPILVPDVADVIPWTLAVQNQQTLSSMNTDQSKGTKMDMSTLYTPNEIADYLHVSRGTIYGLLRNNEIGSVKVRRNRRFTAGHVKEYLAKRGPEVVIDKLYSN